MPKVSPRHFGWLFSDFDVIQRWFTASFAEHQDSCDAYWGFAVGGCRTRRQSSLPEPRVSLALARRVSDSYLGFARYIGSGSLVLAMIRSAGWR